MAKSKCCVAWMAVVCWWAAWPLAAQEAALPPEPEGAVEGEALASATVPEETGFLGRPSQERAWVEEAQRDAGKLPAQVRAAAMVYGQELDSSTTEVIYEGTLARYPFGHRQPTLVCAPLRVCVIVLEAGETVHEVMVGDSEHWQLEQLSLGDGGATPALGVRPIVEFGDACDKTTNVAITTDRRFYSIVLEVPPCAPAAERDENPQRPYHSQLAFYYPDDILQRWTKRARMRRQRGKLVQPATRLAANVGELNWSYRIRGGKKFPWRPQAVFDDGIRTYIRLPPEARELPVVFEVSGGEDAVVNHARSASDRSLLVVSRVSQHLVLVLPRGQGTVRLQLLNEGLEP